MKAFVYLAVLKTDVAAIGEATSECLTFPAPWSRDENRAACFEVTLGTTSSSKCVFASDTFWRFVFCEVRFLLCIDRDLTLQEASWIIDEV